MRQKETEKTNTTGTDVKHRIRTDSDRKNTVPLNSAKKTLSWTDSVREKNVQ